jgi:hypothetical protein
MDVPKTPPRRLPGTSAGQWNERAFRASIALIIFVLPAVPSSLLPEPLKTLIVVGCSVGLVGAGALGIWAVVERYQAMNREREAGYTTLGYPDRQSLWRLDPATGAVVLRPSEQPKETRRATAPPTPVDTPGAPSMSEAGSRETGGGGLGSTAGYSGSTTHSTGERRDARPRVRLTLISILLVGAGLVLRTGTAFGPLAAVVVAGLVIVAAILAVYLGTRPMNPSTDPAHGTSTSPADASPTEAGVAESGPAMFVCEPCHFVSADSVCPRCGRGGLPPWTGRPRGR